MRIFHVEMATSEGGRGDLYILSWETSVGPIFLTNKKQLFLKGGEVCLLLMRKNPMPFLQLPIVVVFVLEHGICFGFGLERLILYALK